MTTQNVFVFKYFVKRIINIKFTAQNLYFYALYKFRLQKFSLP